MLVATNTVPLSGTWCGNCWRRMQENNHRLLTTASPSTGGRRQVVRVRSTSHALSVTLATGAAVRVGGVQYCQECLQEFRCTRTQTLEEKVGTPLQRSALVFGSESFQQQLFFTDIKGSVSITSGREKCNIKLSTISVDHRLNRPGPYGIIKCIINGHNALQVVNRYSVQNKISYAMRNVKEMQKYYYFICETITIITTRVYKTLTLWRM